MHDLSGENKILTELVHLTFDENTEVVFGRLSIIDNADSDAFPAHP